VSEKAYDVQKYSIQELYQKCLWYDKVKNENLKAHKMKQNVP
jgi:hypothetical protein